VINTNRIKGRLRELDMTQADLAVKVGLSPATMNQKINGLRPLFLNEAEAIASALSIPDTHFVDYFFSRELRSAENIEKED